MSIGLSPVVSGSGSVAKTNHAMLQIVKTILLCTMIDLWHNQSAARALNSSVTRQPAMGPFRPVVTTDGNGRAINVGTSYLSSTRASRRKNCPLRAGVHLSPAVASPVPGPVGYLSTRPAVRELPHDPWQSMAADIDGKGNSISVFLQQP